MALNREAMVKKDSDVRHVDIFEEGCRSACDRGGQFEYKSNSFIGAPYRSSASTAALGEGEGEGKDSFTRLTYQADNDSDNEPMPANPTEEGDQSDFSWIVAIEYDIEITHLVATTANAQGQTTCK
jgi:hypothetical protein